MSKPHQEPATNLGGSTFAQQFTNVATEATNISAAITAGKLTHDLDIIRRIEGLEQLIYQIRHRLNSADQ